MYTQLKGTQISDKNKQISEKFETSKLQILTLQSWRWIPLKTQVRSYSNEIPRNSSAEDTPANAAVRDSPTFPDAKFRRKKGEEERREERESERE